MAENNKVLVAAFHIDWATDHCINKNTQSILDFLTSFLLAKAYYSFYQPEHWLLLLLLLSSRTYDFAHNYGQGR